MRIWLVSQEHPTPVFVDRIRTLSEPLGWSVVGYSALGILDSRLVQTALLDVLVYRMDAIPSLDGTAMPEVRVPILGLCTEASTPPQIIHGTHTALILPWQADDLTIQFALCGLQAAWQRETLLREEIARLEKRLADRIVIEKAKSVIMKQWGITEEAAYEQLRVQSRRQRKQMGEIAQSILDSQFLLGDAGPSSVSD